MMEFMTILVFIGATWGSVATAIAIKHWDEVGVWRERYYRLRRKHYRREKAHDTIRGNVPADLFAEFNGQRTDKQADEPTSNVEGESDEGR